jgi:hypothetical protein
MLNKIIGPITLYSKDGSHKFFRFATTAENFTIRIFLSDDQETSQNSSKYFLTSLIPENRADFAEIATEQRKIENIDGAVIVDIRSFIPVIVTAA